MNNNININILQEKIQSLLHHNFKRTHKIQNSLHAFPEFNDNRKHRQNLLPTKPKPYSSKNSYENIPTELDVNEKYKTQISKQSNAEFINSKKLFLPNFRKPRRLHIFKYGTDRSRQTAARHPNLLSKRVARNLPSRFESEIEAVSDVETERQLLDFVKFLANQEISLNRSSPKFRNYRRKKRTKINQRRSDSLIFKANLITTQPTDLDENFYDYDATLSQDLLVKENKPRDNIWDAENNLPVENLDPDPSRNLDINPNQEKSTPDNYYTSFTLGTNISQNNSLHLDIQPLAANFFRNFSTTERPNMASLENTAPIPDVIYENLNICGEFVVTDGVYNSSLRNSVRLKIPEENLIDPVSKIVVDFSESNMFNNFECNYYDECCRFQ